MLEDTSSPDAPQIMLIQANAVERVHLQFCKMLLGVKKSMQNDFIYDEYGRTSLLVKGNTSLSNTGLRF